MIEQYRQMGATEADIARAGLTEQEQIAREGITVLAPNWPVLRLFMACSQQWRTGISPMGRLVRTGLSWPDVEIRARHLPETRHLDEEQADRLWADIETLQNAALECMQELRNEQH